MSIRTSPWPHGVPCWADITVPDVAAAQAFYGAVLGWTFSPPDEAMGGYVIASANGAAAAALGPVHGDAPTTVWTLYLASDDADATAAAISEHGGTVLLPPGDVGPQGRMLIAMDPTGAPFGVWQAGSHIGAGVVNQPGGLTWEDLRSPDPDAARAFYSAVFGYTHDAVDGAPSDYRTFHAPGESFPLGGMGGMFGMEHLPPHWLVYFGVADAAAAVDAARAHGGSVVMEAFDTPYGRMAGLIDPDGAAFWVAQTDGSNQPDRSG